jgi:hypothetical protein
MLWLPFPPEIIPFEVQQNLLVILEDPASEAARAVTGRLRCSTLRKAESGGC